MQLSKTCFQPQMSSGIVSLQVNGQRLSFARLLETRRKLGLHDVLHGGGTVTENVNSSCMMFFTGGGTVTENVNSS